MVKYKLINPTITGTLNTTVNEKNENIAAKKLWTNLAENIVGNIPHLLFTIKNESSDQIHHYSIKEKIDSNKNADILIEKINVKITPSQKKKFLQQIKIVEEQQIGGKKSDKRKRYKDDSSSSSSNSDSDEMDNYINFMKYKKRTPIFRYWYTPTIYTNNNSLTIFNPVFKSPLSPYVELYIPTSF